MHDDIKQKLDLV